MFRPVASNPPWLAAYEPVADPATGTVLPVLVAAGMELQDGSDLQLQDGTRLELQDMYVTLAGTLKLQDGTELELPDTLLIELQDGADLQLEDLVGLSLL